ncbi:sensor domain-containing diguanylate cyclase [Pelotomaculum sp. PtaB.Bin117]|uniref:sensor domain-containing diguanylate cyclase n=1 Tax=Pelotomaculum sp. PtaB.Bin117 TaxID=1811694 RepID=UPI0009C4B84C|nr:sensor domain-containing diguanylate cyclase [Pelotomaculum sp. PtaB.Bin117]OPX85188.1 MAG: Response regulator PleD [Pelotomaculum sp. PtaB.Bin117]OPY63818.1 MAG: Response regulator PleD [Pelotomaculum sp. PtaU1.Bin065]
MEDYKNELKYLLERERTAKIICAELNNFMDLKSTLITIIDHVKKLTKCGAIGIRLQDNGDYPYYVYNGFPESFIIQENSLCDKGKDADNTLECMCGKIISGRYEPYLPFFTKGGSFWSNNTSDLTATTSEHDRRGKTLYYCNSCGYESVALIPIKARGKRIGLIQLNDISTGMFTIELIEYLEMIAEQVGLAVQNSLAYDKLRELSIKDSLTGLYNRRGFFEFVNKELSRARRDGTTFGILSMDIDNFKEVNDQFGHLIGDQVLKNFAQTLNSTIRDYDLACRFGGDEFVVIVNTSLKGLDFTQKRIQDRLIEWISSEKVTSNLGISIGSVIWEPGRTENIDELLKVADQSMYKNKMYKKHPEK